MKRKGDMNIIQVDDLRVANRATLFAPSTDMMQPILEMNNMSLSNIIQDESHTAIHNAISFTNHYMSDKIFDDINEVSNDIGYSYDPTLILFKGDLHNLPDITKLALLHDENIYDLLQDGEIEGYGYKFTEPLHETSLYQNINGNVATPTMDMELYVDSSEYDISLESYLHVSDMLEAAYKMINDEDFTKKETNV